MFLRNCCFLAVSSIILAVPSSTLEDDAKVAKESWNSITLKETGLEFIHDDFHLNINESLYFLENNDLNLEDFSPVEIVQAFIRDVKGITDDVPPNGELGSGLQEAKTKPDWNFYPYRMKTLSEIEVRIYRVLKEYYEKKPNLRPYPTLESYFKDLENSSLKALRLSQTYATIRPKNWNPNSILNEDPHLYIATHPLLIYRMIRRFAHDLQPILFNLVDQGDGVELLDTLFEVANPDLEVFPNATDLEATWKSMLRTQNGVNLKTNDFANGKLETVETGLGLNALHALEIGMFFLEESNFDFAIEWVYIATETIQSTWVAQKFPIIAKFFNSCLTHAVNKHNSMWEGNHINEWSPGVFNSTVTIPFQPSSYVRMYELNKPKAALNRNGTKWSSSVKTNFYETCAGKNLQSAEEKAALKCYSVWEKDPYWYINPLKVEMLHDNPPLYQIHEFIGDKMIEAIKAAAKVDLKRSTVVDRSHPSRSIVDPTRTSSQTWIHDSAQSGEFMRPLTYRMEKLSGLVIAPPEAQDAFQVALYGPSHHYEAHIDSFEDPRRTTEKGNRVATLMGYLSNTEVGGRTGFPVLGAFADPAKGSVVMWYNMRRHFEDRDMRTWHGGCPVVLGTKWITNKWVYSHKNVFNFKCGLNQDD